MDSVKTDVLLVRCKLARAEGLHLAAQGFFEQAGLRLDVAAWSRDAHWAYVYGRPAAPTALDREVLAGLGQLWRQACPGATEIDVARLELVQDLPGASRGSTATRHYVVETDPEAGWDEEIVRWYTQEHLPGLAAVSGTIRARRFVNHDGGPRSHACYALVSEETLGCPPWLAVRGTEWSSRVRPHFTNTRRTMMERLA